MIDEHAKRYQEQKVELAERRAAEQDHRRYEMIQMYKSLPKHYKAKTMLCEEREHEISPNKYHTKEASKKRADKRHVYSTIASEVHQPIIDERKRIEMEGLIAKWNNKDI